MLGTSLAELECGAVPVMPIGGKAFPVIKGLSQRYYWGSYLASPMVHIFILKPKELIDYTLPRNVVKFDPFLFPFMDRAENNLIFGGLLTI